MGAALGRLHEGLEDILEYAYTSGAVSYMTMTLEGPDGDLEITVACGVGEDAARLRGLVATEDDITLVSEKGDS